jgi:hypothetical protein
VNKNLALLAVFFNLIESAVLVATKLNLFTALFLLGSGDYLTSFAPEQLHALLYIFIRSDGYGFAFGLLFFGFECLILGYLIFRSGYLPRTLGVFMQIAGLCYLINSLALFLSSTFANMIFPAILVPAFIGESSLCLWFIVKGVNMPEWEKQTALGQVSRASIEI